MSKIDPNSITSKQQPISGHLDSGFNEFGPPRERMDLHTGSGGGKVGMGGDAGSQPGISDIPNGTQNHGLPGQPSEQRVCLFPH